MSFRLPQLKAAPIPRQEGITDRLVLVGLGGRFMDELLSGLPYVLMPTIRARFGLSYAEVGLLDLALNYVAAGVEPVNGLLIDLWQRRWLMAFGATALGLSVVVMGLAPTFLLLLVGFGLYGLGSGPLAHTADVVLIDSHPRAPDRIFARSNLIDSVGALLGPLAVSAAGLIGLEWRWLLVTAGVSSLLYAVYIWRTPFPPFGRPATEAGKSTLRSMRDNLRDVLSNRTARLWLLFLFVHAIQELPMLFATVWLREQVGMSQAVIGIYRALELMVTMGALVYLDRWRQHRDYRRILLVASLGALILFPAWLLLPGIPARFILGVPLTFLLAVIWPIARAQSLVSVPGKAGTVTAAESVLGFVPISLLFGLLAEWITLNEAMLWVHLGATLALTALVFLLPPESRERTG